MYLFVILFNISPVMRHWGPCDTLIRMWRFFWVITQTCVAKTVSCCWVTFSANSSSGQVTSWTLFKSFSVKRIEFELPAQCLQTFEIFHFSDVACFFCLLLKGPNLCCVLRNIVYSSQHRSLQAGRKQQTYEFVCNVSDHLTACFYIHTTGFLLFSGFFVRASKSNTINECAVPLFLHINTKGQKY